MPLQQLAKDPPHNGRQNAYAYAAYDPLAHVSCGTIKLRNELTKATQD